MTIVSASAEEAASPAAKPTEERSFSFRFMVLVFSV
jgi:hypothetical protein